jgi:hypothetical protein
MNSFICKQCEKEHNKSMKEKGYGYSYLGTIVKCDRHDKIKQNAFPISNTGINK